ncbi:hypothetical protein BJY24_006721 [Nocardia transvalensis]|uniref:NACHT domain-containing protein n=1 Tax=Nocardia transvalensis TaxID=37333 RepID=A0A7W9ULQ8_9NOCA|nr:hypothetical protein [Nocardia transvalensis]MBB5917809.1 hypothetical protein [Nocardia transvalensis]
MTIADLVAAPDQQQNPLKTLAHVEFQLRVLGLMCAAAADEPTGLTTPGSLDTWSRYIILNKRFFNCDACESLALDVADGINTEIAGGASVRKMRNQVFHGGPDPENIDYEILDQVVTQNASHISEIYDHRHVIKLEPFFITIRGELAILNDYSAAFATYWPRRGPATDITDAEILDSLQRLGPQSGDRLSESYALDIQKDLRGFAERNSIQILVEPPGPIVARWDLRTSSGASRRVDNFEIDVDHARIWRSDSGPRPYKEFLADICNWELLKERLLEELEDSVELQSQISEELFPDLKRHIPNVPAQVHVAAGIFGDGRAATITEVCNRITARTNIYSAATNLITLTGEAGSGKTHSLLQFARESLSPGGGLKPIAIYISSSGSTAQSLDTLLDSGMPRTRIVDKSSILALCRAGLAILVIDGFDELLGFRTYDNPLTGLKPIFDALRGKGTVILSARSSYWEARLRQNLALRDAMDWPPHVTALELLPWRTEQLRELTSQLAVDTTWEHTPAETRQLLTTPFFCLAFAAWARSGTSYDFLPFVVEVYLQRERRKMPGSRGGDLFATSTLADIFSEVAELAARKAVPEISEEELELAASAALDRELTKEEGRRLIALCGVSAEWSDDDLSFKFTHLAIAEQFLARQVARLPIKQAVTLLLAVPISALCARLIVSMWRTEQLKEPHELIAALQRSVTNTEPFEHRSPGAISLGELWSNVYGTVGDSPRIARRITVDYLELRGTAQVDLDQAYIQHLVVGPGIQLRMRSCRVELLDLSNSSEGALIGDSHKQVLQLLTRSELAVGPWSIERALGLAEDSNGGEIDSYFKSHIALSRGPVIVIARDFSPDGEVSLNWILEYGLDEWQDFIRRNQREGEITLEKVNAGGRLKVRVRLKQKITEE